MSRRRLLLFGVSVAVVVVVGGMFVLWSQPRTAITLENVARIEVGMTLAEVETILGSPAGDYRTNRRGPPPAIMFAGGETVTLWHEDATSVGIVLDEHGLVQNVGIFNQGHEPILWKVRRWLRM